MKNNFTYLFKLQFLGVLNDNLLKSLICFVSIYWGAPEDKSLIVAAASATIVLPFIFLSPLAGYLSQIREQTNILRIAKFIEIPIMLVALIGFFMNYLALVLFAMLCMGVQSALYSPAKYSLLKSLSAKENVSKQLGIMELLSFVGVLGGSLLAGLIADVTTFQFVIITTVLLSIAFAGWVYSYKIDFKRVSAVIKPKKELNPLQFLKTNYAKAKDFKGVNGCILGLGVFWFMGSLLQMNILIHCPEVLGLSNAQTGMVTAFVAVGIGLGCYVAGLVTKNRLEIGLVAFAAFGLTLSTILLSTVSTNTPFFILLLLVSSFFGGMFKVPLNAWIQERSSKEELSNILAYSNIVVFLFILVSALVFALMQTYMDTRSIFILISFFAGVTTIVTLKMMPVRIVRFLVFIMSKVIFKTHVNGLANVPTRTGGIIISNHVSLLDIFLIVATAPRNLRVIVHEKVYNAPVLHFFFSRLNVIPVGSNNSPEKREAFAQKCREEVHKGHLVCIFPEGQLSRNGHLQIFKKGIEHIVNGYNIPVIPMQIDNLVGSPMSFKTGTTETYAWSFNNVRQDIYITVGKPIVSPLTAFELRQTVKELEVQNFASRTAHLSRKEALDTAKRQIYKSGDAFLSNDSTDVSNLLQNTPNYEVTDLTGAKVMLMGTKEGSVGRPITGVAVKIVNNEGEALVPNKSGIVYLKHAFSNDITWKNTGLTGSMDEAGFVNISK